MGMSLLKSPPLALFRILLGAPSPGPLGLPRTAPCPRALPDRGWWRGWELCRVFCLDWDPGESSISLLRPFGTTIQNNTHPLVFYSNKYLPVDLSSWCSGAPEPRLVWGNARLARWWGRVSFWAMPWSGSRGVLYG